MNIRLLVTALILAAGQPAIADFEIVTLVRAVELSPSNMILPASTSGMMTYKPCADECENDYERARLTPETTYMVAGKAVKFADFQEEYAIAKSAENSYALLSVDIKSKTVTSINIAR